MSSASRLSHPGLRFASLGSGSRGNGTLIASGRTRVLLDCGFPIKETCARLLRRGVEPESLSAIIVTHEHGDHVRGVGPLARKYGVPVWMTTGTWRAVEDTCGGLPALHLFSSHAPFAIGDLHVQPFPVPHDAREPTQFVFSDGDLRLGVLTDTGASTPHIERSLGGCHALLLECNHDLDMLRRSHYPESLKERIAGRLGHLDNATAAGILARLDRQRLQHVVAAHLSEHNNTPLLAAAALAAALDCAREWIQVCDQDAGLDWRELRH